MGGNISPKDMEIISDGVLNGLGSMDELPNSVKGALTEYWGSMGIDATQPDSQMTQDQLAALKEQRQAQQGGIFSSPIFKPIEWVGSKLYQVYSSTISPALSAGAMAAHSLVYGRPDYIGQDGEMDALSDYWNYAHKVSPGQSIWMLGMNNDELKARGIRPDQIAHDQALQEKGQFRDTPTKNDPLGIKTKSQEYFGAGPSKYVTGATDFAVSWYADPLVLAGKGLGAVKAAKTTRNVAAEITKGEQVALKANAALTPEQANQLAWNSFSQKSYFQGLTDHIWNIKTANPDTAAAVLNRKVPTLSKGANGPAAARLLSQAGSKAEVANVLRVTMNDTSAIHALKFQNAELAYQAEQLSSSVSTAGSYYHGLSTAQQATPFGQRVKGLMDQRSKDLAKLDEQSQIVSDKIRAAGTIGNLNYNQITTTAGLKVRNALEGTRGWTPFSNAGMIKSQVNNIYSLSLGGVVKLAHTYNDIKPTHFIDVKDSDGYRQLNASLLEVKGLNQEARDMYVSQYLNAPEAMRAATLQTVEQKVARNLVDRYNDTRGLTGTSGEISHDIADSLYQEVAGRRSAAQGAMKSQSFGTVSVADPNVPGASLRVDEITPDGGNLVVAPLLRTQMANGHAMMDFKLFQNALESNGSFWQKAKLQHGDKWQTAVGLADYVGSIWKFSQLFRLGYGPRALADDALGQLARFGPVAMASRSIKGGKYTFEQMRRSMIPGNVFENAMVARSDLEGHLDDLGIRQSSLENDLNVAKIEGRHADVQSLTDELNANIDDIATARQSFADMDKMVKGGQAYKHTEQGRQIFDPAYAGAEGGLYRDLASGDKNFSNMMGTAADAYLGRFRRMDWVQMSPAKHGAEVHMDAWLKTLNQQVAHDKLASKYLKGESPQKLEAWLSTPEGTAYKANHRIAQTLPHDQLVDRVTAQIDEWANPAFPNGEAIRQAAARGEVTKDMLNEVPQANRPLVNAQGLAYARGSHQAMQVLDNWMSKYYELVGAAPNRYLLRNPLFAQRYNVHLRELMQTGGKTGERMTESTRLQYESAARRRALQEVKKNTFTMDYETKLSHNLRNFGAFFGAQQESWNRWARIISDKPDILPRVAQVYGAPARAGLETDQNGNQIDAAGYTTDPITGEKTLVDYADRHIVVQVPDYLGGKQFKKFFGLDPNAKFDIPMSTAEIILNHGDGPLPVGAGPYVQMAANNIPFSGMDANGDPSLADLYQKLGILPFGPTTSNAQAFLPNWWRKANQDNSQNMWYIMQAEDYKYREGLRKTAPTWKEISDRASGQTWLKVLTAAVLPISMSEKDPYQFFRDQYRQMQNIDPDKADQQFYDKYGDSAYVFAQSMSKNNSGLKPTVEAVKMSKYYQDLVGKVGPEWAGLIVGDEGNGKYSNGAYYYEKTHSAAPGAGVTERANMSPREALQQANLSRGWKQYQGYMNSLYGQLFSRGLQTFDDAGAEDLKSEKQSLVKTLTEQRVMDENGVMQDNQYYNKEWAKAYTSIDKGYYDRATQDMRAIVNDPEIWSKAVNPDGSVGVRSDIYTLKTYLSYRDDVKRALILRNEAGGSDDINAQENADIKGQWNALVIKLIESDTKFGDLHTRYLSRDMGFDQETVVNQAQQGALAAFQGDTSAVPEQSIFDQLATQGGA